MSGMALRRNLDTMLERNTAGWLVGLIGFFWALIIVGYPLTSAITTVFALPNRPVSISVRGITLLVALGIFALVALRERRLYRGIYWVPLAVFWTWYLARLGYDSAFAPENLRLSPPEYFLWAVGATLVPVLAFMARCRDDELDWALRLTLWGGALACGLLLALAIFTDARVATYFGYRFTLATLNPITAGHTGLMVAVLAAASFLRSGQRWQDALVSHLVPLTFGIAVALLASTRSVMLSLAFIWALMLWISWGKRALGFGLVSVPAIVAGALVLQIGFGYGTVQRVVQVSVKDVPAAPAKAQQRQRGTEEKESRSAKDASAPLAKDRRAQRSAEEKEPRSAKDAPTGPVKDRKAQRTSEEKEFKASSDDPEEKRQEISVQLRLVDDTERTKLLTDSWKAFVKHPLLGAGIEPLGQYPHNLIVESFLAIGIVGGMVFVSLVLISTIAAWIVLRTDRTHFWIGLLFVQHMIWAMLSGSLYGSAATWCLMAAVVARASQLTVSAGEMGGSVAWLSRRLSADWRPVGWRTGTQPKTAT